MRGAAGLEPPAASSRSTFDMDFLTGKAAREVYLDTDKVSGKDGKLLSPTSIDTNLAEQLYTPVKVVQDLPTDNILVVQDGADRVLRMHDEGVLTVKPEAKAGVADILDLNDFSEQSLLLTLRSRYDRGDAYTFVGPILISINPYKWNNELYSEANMIEYHRTGTAHLAPHLFKVAEQSYNAFLNEGSKVPCNQSIIVSGESGAGKTEAMKIIMQYLARITHYKVHANSHEGPESPTPGPCLEVGELEQKVLSTNPLLESFGNAKTQMNDNSSRFGKYVKIQFGSSGRIIGAEVINYLLEKTRIVYQREADRNFHIFYQLLHGGDKQLLSDLGLDGSTPGQGKFRYLTHGSDMEIPGRSDAEDFRVTCACMASIGIDRGLQRLIFELLAAVLHLGNISFVDDVEGQAEVVADTIAHLEFAAAFLRLDAAEVRRTFCSKQIVTGQDDVVISPNNAAEAIDKRDTLAKTVYSCIFNWLVRRLNSTIAVEQYWGFMGVLDIYGFEAFEKNTFEQLLINFANETLQNQFNRHIFEMEQDEYEREGIDWSYVSFNDNQPCLALLDNRYHREPAADTLASPAAGSPPGKAPPQCLFSLLDDVKVVGTSATWDSRFLSTLHSTFANKNDVYVKPRLHADECFGIRHYAGEVEYTVDGFVESNMENLHQNVRTLALSSTEPMIADEIFWDIKQMQERGATRRPSRMAKDARGARLREASLSAQFRSSLAMLVETLDQTSPRYVRCIKPNNHKQPLFFHGKDIMRQLKYAGMMEAIRIRQQGYALRESHSVLFKQFARLVPGCRSLPDLVQRLSSLLNVGQREWQIGMSKVFMRKNMAEKLETLLDTRVRLATRTIQRAWRYHRCWKATLTLQRVLRGLLHRLRFQRTIQRIILLQNLQRMRKEYLQLKRIKRAAIRLQAEVRRFLATKRYERQHNRFVKLSEDDVIRLLFRTESESKAALESRDFKLCQKLARRDQLLKAAIDIKRQTSQCPEFGSRQELETAIESLEGKIQVASQKKDYSTCSRLAEQVKGLMDCRELLPTRNEVLRDIEQLQKVMESHFQARDFKACDDVQLQVRVLEYKYQALLHGPEPNSVVAAAGETVEFQSRAELDFAIMAAENELSSLQQDRKYAECAVAQGELERLMELRKLMPTAAETEDRVAALEQELSVAAQAQRFQECARLQNLVTQAKEEVRQLAQQERKLSEGSTQAAGGERSRRSRVNIEAELEAVRGQLQKQVVAKNFHACGELQARQRDLDAELAALPSQAELEASIAGLKDGLRDSLMAKDFARCATLQAEIQALNAELQTSPLQPVEPIPVMGGCHLTKKFSPAISDHTGPAAPRLTVSPVKSRAGSKLSASGSRAQEGGRQPHASPTVAKLRPDKPIIVLASTSINDVATIMVEHRAKAVLVTGTQGGIEGILTDTDVTRRVVARDLSPDSIRAADVMTSDPTVVSVEDSALDALSTMVKGRFRHLPVLDQNGKAVVGCLDIARCLTDAIRRLERMEAKSQSKAQSDVQIPNVASVVAKVKHQGQQAVVKTLLEILSKGEAEAGKLPTVSEIISRSESTAMYRAEATVHEASKGMSTSRKACLVIGSGAKLVGLVSYKDILSRVVCQRQDAKTISVGSIMTRQPRYLTPDMSVLDALYTMRDGHVLNLPVVDEISGRAIGLVNAMEVIKSLAELTGQDDGGRSFWARTMEDPDMETRSESNLQSSVLSSSMRVSSHPARSSGREEPLQGRVPSGSHKVAKLRPEKALILPAGLNVSQVARKMVEQRRAAVLLQAEDGSVTGILTDTDVTRRVIAKGQSSERVKAASVMTKNPKTVSAEDDALEALSLMVQGKFRHLPVTQYGGHVVGCLDIARCLNDAITRLERLEERQQRQGEDTTFGSNLQIASAALAMAEQSKSKTQQQAMRKAILQLLSTGGSGGEEEARQLPNVAQILAACPPAAFYRGDTTVSEASQGMSTSRKACLVVGAGGRPEGLVSFKDLLNQVAVKGRDPSQVSLSSIMTARPRCIAPDVSLLDALYTMRDGHFLNLPVADESTGKALGLLSVMELVEALARLSGKADGGRAFWAQTMVDDDLDKHSDVGSLRSCLSGSRISHAISSTGISGGEGVRQQRVRTESHTVRKLRPEKPVVLASSHSVADVAKVMKDRRVAAVLLAGEDGGLAGILTDTDVTRRLVARDRSCEEVRASEAMTTDPETVGLDAGALDALSTMVKGGYRHLPVMDKDHVVGCLDIAKCLSDAISRLEKYEEQKTQQTKEGGSAMGTKVAKALAGQAGKGQHATLAALMQVLAAAGQEGEAHLPTMSEMLADAEATPMLSPETNVSQASKQMASSRKACLVVAENGSLLGLVSFRDVLCHVVVPRQDPKQVYLGSFMTKQPRSVTPDMSLLDALYTMRDGHFLNLPIVDENSGRALGLVSVMEVVQSLARLTGEDDGGRSFWARTVNDEGWNSQSEVGSISGRSSVAQSSTVAPPPRSVTSSLAKSRYRPVSKLRPPVPLILQDSTMTVFEAAKIMAGRRVAAALVREGRDLAGILTDTDIAKHVVGNFGSSETVEVRDIMSRNVRKVGMESCSLDALTSMVEARLRHLAVVDAQGRVVGLLDIARCLSDAISRLELNEEGNDKPASLDASTMGRTDAFQSILRLMQEQAGPGQDVNPSVGRLLAQVGGAVNQVRPTINVMEAARRMRVTGQPALVLAEGDMLVGILTPRDLMTRVIAAAEYTPHLTLVEKVMTPNPDVVESSATVLDALRMMRDGHYLHLPVIETGRVLGVLDVMDVVQAVVGIERGHPFWASKQRESDMGSELSSNMPLSQRLAAAARPRPKVELDPEEHQLLSTSLDPNEELESASVLADKPRIASPLLRVPPPTAASIVGSQSKFSDPGNEKEGVSFRLKVVSEDQRTTKTVSISTSSFAVVMQSVGNAFALKESVIASRALTYEDEQKDVLTVDSDEALQGMMVYVQEHGLKVLKVQLIRSKRGSSKDGGLSSPIHVNGNMPTIIAVVAASGTLALLALTLMRRRRE